MKKETILAIAVIVMIITVAVWGALKPELIPSFNLVLLAGLIGVTTVYAYSTIQIARATKEQFLGEARPYLLLRLAKEPVQSNETEAGKQLQTEFKVTIRNVGNGPAINIEAALWYRHEPYSVGDSKGYLASGEEWQTSRSRLSTGIEEEEGWLQKMTKIVKEGTPRIIAVKYQDIHKRAWISYIRYLYMDTYLMEGEQDIVELKND